MECKEEFRTFMQTNLYKLKKASKVKWTVLAEYLDISPKSFYYWRNFKTSMPFAMALAVYDMFCDIADMHRDNGNLLYEENIYDILSQVDIDSIENDRKAMLRNSMK